MTFAINHLPDNWYNEIDPFAAQWLRELIKAGHIAPGDVDERSIEDVTPDDLRPYTQCHFFAGIGVWSHALRQAGWPDDRPVWTGSCPCQPFSAAGKGAGFDDERHLWPAWDWLIDFREPPVIFGEQVASKDAEPWLDLVQADLEDLGYAFGAVAFPSASIGAPHIRDRTYWVADAGGARLAQRSISDVGRGTVRVEGSPAATGELPRLLADTNGLRQPWIGGSREAGTTKPSKNGRLGHAERLGTGGNTRAGAGAQGGHGGGHVGDDARPSGAVRGLAYTDRTGAQRRSRDAQEAPRLPQAQREPEHHANVSQRDGADRDGRGAMRGDGLSSDGTRPGPVNGLWRDADWLLCRDGKWRPVEPGTFPLAHGAPARVGRLRGYGNAINAVQAQVFIEAYLEGAA